jgi:hypothetical protein
LELEIPRNHQETTRILPLPLLTSLRHLLRLLPIARGEDARRRWHGDRARRLTIFRFELRQKFELVLEVNLSEDAEGGKSNEFHGNSAAKPPNSLVHLIHFDLLEQL